MIANKASWKNLPISEQRELIPFQGLYSDLETENICRGFVPDSMDDKWFIYSEKGWVFFHRSWTGHCVFMLKLDSSLEGSRVTEAWVTRDLSHYNSSGVEGDLTLLSGLVQSLLTG